MYTKFFMKIIFSCADGELLSKYGCEGELVKIDCDNSLVIDIVRANYGRLSSQVCAVTRGPGTPPGHVQHRDCLHRLVINY